MAWKLDYQWIQGMSSTNKKLIGNKFQCRNYSPPSFNCHKFYWPPNFQSRCFNMTTRLCGSGMQLLQQGLNANQNAPTTHTPPSGPLFCFFFPLKTSLVVTLWFHRFHLCRVCINATRLVQCISSERKSFCFINKRIKDKKWRGLNGNFSMFHSKNIEKSATSFLHFMFI